MGSSDTIAGTTSMIAKTAQNTSQSSQYRSRITRKESRNLPEKEKERLKRACEDFESVFVNILLRAMRNSVSSSDLLHGGAGEDVFQGMLDEERSTQIAKTQQFGLGKVLYQELSGERAYNVREAAKAYTFKDSKTSTIPDK